MRPDSAESHRSKFGFPWILALLVVALFALVFFYMRQGSQETHEVTETVLAPTSDTPAIEQSRQVGVEQDSKSEAAATQILTDLKRFQDAAEGGMDYDEYDRKLNSLKTDLNNTLSSFVRHNPNDEIFRQEVAAVLQDDTAAAQWWKTTITNSGVFTEADRNERTQRIWASARAHLTNAEKMLNP